MHRVEDGGFGLLELDGLCLAKGFVRASALLDDGAFHEWNAPYGAKRMLLLVTDLILLWCCFEVWYGIMGHQIGHSCNADKNLSVLL